MTELVPAAPPHQVAFESFGVRIGIGLFDAAELERAMDVLPPGWRPCGASDVEKRFAIVPDGDGRYQVLTDAARVTEAGIELDQALLLLESELRAYIALHSSAMIFVHAGVVAHGGRALVLPGMSYRSPELRRGTGHVRQ